MRLLTIILSAALPVPVTNAVAQNTSDREQVIQRERGTWRDVKEKDVPGSERPWTLPTPA